jgi:hypothetical protein
MPKRKSTAQKNEVVAVAAGCHRLQQRRVVPTRGEEKGDRAEEFGCAVVVCHKVNKVEGYY